MANKITEENKSQASIEQLNARLSELKGMKVSPVMKSRNIDEVNAEKFDAMAKAYGAYDVDKSLELQQKAQELRDKKILAEQKKSASQDPDAIRFKIQSAINSVRGDMQNLSSGDPRRKGLQDTLDALIAELQLDTPSIQHAYVIANGGVIGGGSKLKTLTEYTDEINNLKDKAEIDKVISQATQAGLNGPELTNLNAVATTRKKLLTPKGKSEEDKDVFKTFLEGSKTTLGTIAAATALGQSMGQKIQSAISNKDKELNQSDTQQLAAMIYQTYNPGALVGGEMSSAVGALKGSEAWRQYIDAGLAGMGISSNNVVPIRKAIEKYNSAVKSGANEYKTYLANVSKYKSDPNTKYAFIDAFNTGLVDPSTYLVSSSGGTGNAGGIPVPNAIVVKKGTIRPSGGKKYMAIKDLTASEAKKAEFYKEVK
jgi:hypothetical protein